MLALAAANSGEEFNIFRFSFPGCEMRITAPASQGGEGGGIKDIKDFE
jgi:hypothetical protein